jgi:hypothetical protein
MPRTIKPGTIVRETLALQLALLKGQKISELGDWVGDSELRQALLRLMVFGRIRWPRSVGRPQSATLNQGFTILHTSTYVGIAEGQGGPVVTTNTVTLAEPYKWDEPDDTDHYCVGFFTQVQILFPQEIQPTFASNVAWPYVLNHYRVIDPPDWSGSVFNEGVTIPDFTVSLELW